MTTAKYTPTYGQASRIFVRFGGAIRLAKLIGRTPSALFRWNHPRELGGLDGLVPTKAVANIKAAAELMDVELTNADWAP